MASSPAIAPLPPEVVAQIKSSVSITSVNGVIIQLLKNSLDASAGKIDVQVDYGRGSCIVEDDGQGIVPAEFQPSGGLAKLHHTSKHASNTETHGTQGCFLASLAALSLLSITSHHHLHRSHNSIALSRSQVISRQTPAPEAQHLVSLNHGTRVTVRNLFGDMPVRVRQRAMENAESSRNPKDWDALRKEVTALILSWHGPISVAIKELASNTKLRTLRISSRRRDINDDGALISHICSTLAQASFTPSVDTSSWVSASGSTSTVSIRSGISLDPAPTKGIQFMSFGIHPLSNEDGRNILFEEVNRLFANSSFGIVDDLPQLDETEKKRRAEDKRYKSDGFTNKELKGSRKGVDRWPMFYMRIDIHGPIPSHDPVEDVFEDEKTLVSITKLLQAVIVEFLRSNNFTPKFIRPPGSPSKRKAESSEVDMDGMGLSSSSMKAIYDMSGAPRQATNAAASPKKRAITKLPTRHLSPRPSSPFDVWSRVKSGRVPALVKTSKTELSNVNDGVQATKGVQPLKHVSEEPKVAGKDSASKIEKPIPRSTTPLISKSGAVSQLPFMDVAKPTRRPATSPKDEVPIHESPPVIEKDELVPWTDPTTKENCFVNMRTGSVQQTPKLSNKPTSETRRGLRTLDRKYGSIRHDSLDQSRQPSDWLNSILTNWNNPVFPPAEPPIPQIQPDWTDTHTQSILHGHHHTCTQAAIDRAFQVSATSSTGRLSKSGLQRARVIAQVDRKFILARMPAAASADGEVSGEDMLVIIDQHAADERCRIEALMADFCLPPSPSRGMGQDELVPGVRVERLEKSIVFEVAGAESELLERHRRHFADWGVLYCIRPANPAGEGMDKVVLTALPPGIVERCRLDPKMTIELIRREVWGFDEKGGARPSRQVRGMGGPDGEGETTSPDWVARMQGCPAGILEMLNSRACRGAVMFNDVLERGSVRRWCGGWEGVSSRSCVRMGGRVWCRLLELGRVRRRWGERG
ncbi:DNA mismatch repair protein [Pseudogymnoascus australis]